MLPSVILRAMILMHIVVWVMIHQLIQLILTLEKAKLWSQLAAFWLPLVNFHCIFLDHFAVHRQQKLFTVQVTNQASKRYIFQAKQNHDCHYPKPVRGNEFGSFSTSEKLKTFLHHHFDRKKIDEQFWNQEIKKKKTAEQNIEKMIPSTVSSFIFFVILTKRRGVVRSGIRTHIYKSRLRPERSALDRSAILTCTWSIAKFVLFLSTTFKSCSPFGWQIKPARTTVSWQNKISRLSVFQASQGKWHLKISKHCFNIWKTENFFAWSFWSQNLTSN